MDEIVVEIRDNDKVLFAYRAGHNPRPVVEPLSEDAAAVVVALDMALEHAKRMLP